MSNFCFWEMSPTKILHTGQAPQLSPLCAALLLPLRQPRYVTNDVFNVMSWFFWGTSLTNVHLSSLISPSSHTQAPRYIQKTSVNFTMTSCFAGKQLTEDDEEKLGRLKSHVVDSILYGTWRLTHVRHSQNRKSPRQTIPLQKSHMQFHILK